MAFMMMVLDVDDYDAWKQTFDSDPAGRRQVGKGHRIFRGVDNPNRVFIGTEYHSVEDANATRERLLASGVLDKITVKVEPTIAELADSEDY